MLLQNIIDTVLGKWLGAGKAPLPYGQTEPTPRPDGKIVFEANPTPTPTPNPFNTPTPTPTPTPQVLGSSTSRADSQGRRLAVEDYQGLSKTPIPLPNQEIQDLIWEMFPNEATPAAVALAGENAGYRTDAVNENNNGTLDYGLFQNNTKTLNDMLSKNRYSSQLRSGGINSPEDVLSDPRKSALASKVTRQYENDAGASPWSWWYGWQNKGFNIDPSRPIEEVAGSQYKSGNLPYFKLAEYLDRNNIDY